jgi:CTP:molybdopterin cytidylyltransferase MocA
MCEIALATLAEIKAVITGRSGGMLRERRGFIHVSPGDGERVPSIGVPALFSRALFAELTRLDGRSGVKEVIKRHASEAHFLPFRGGEVDVDTPDDFSRLIAKDAEEEA